MLLKYKNKQGLNKRMCGVKTYATLDKENVRKVFLKIKQHNVIMASKIAYNIKIIN
jgi:hypothetical protein